jgi:alpha-tubulin suppressor-like RCC1 family protein
MKIILSSRRHHYVARVSTFLIVAALIAGMVGCDFIYDRLPNLTITSTNGGSVTEPGEGTYTYYYGTVVSLVATPDAGYQFVNWTGDVGTIADVNDATTIITMNGDYSITAEFIRQYDLTTNSTGGGNVTTPGEGTFTYDERTVVNLVAEAEEGYQFGNWTGDVDTIADVNAAATNITMNGNYSITANFQYIPMVAAGHHHTVGLKYDGTVIAVGWNDYGQCDDVGGWTDIVQVAAGVAHTVGLKSNGTVIAVGDNSYGQCNVGGWTDIVKVSTVGYNTMGLKSDGTVVAAGWNDYGQCNVGNWTNIAQVSAGYQHTVWVKSNGTVVAVGFNSYGQCNVGNWTDIIQVSAGGYYHTIGLKYDGTVVAVGDNSSGPGQCNIGGWTDIVQVAAGRYHTVGVKSDGIVVAAGDNNYGQCNVGSWTDIVQVSASGYCTVGLKYDGTVVAVGDNNYGQCNVGGWDLS